MIGELIRRYEKRAKEVFKFPNPYIRPLFEKSEILTKIKELKKYNQN